MNLNEVLWSKLDLSSFGSLENVEIFDTPQFVLYADDNNPLQYGNGICYFDETGINTLYIIHASCKHPEACSAVWKIYRKYKDKIEEVLGVPTAISNVNPALCGEVYSKEIIDKYGRELQ